MSHGFPLRPLLTFLAVLALLTGCASAPQVDIRRAPGLDLEGARSYGWVDPLGTDRAAYEAAITTRLKRVVGDALEARGLRYDAASPDVRVNFYVNLEARQEIVTTGSAAGGGDPMLGYHGFRSGLYAPWPDYTVETRAYQQGTLTIDLVDAEAGRLAWEAVAVGRVRPEAVQEQDARLARTVQAMFARFP